MAEGSPEAHDSRKAQALRRAARTHRDDAGREVRRAEGRRHARRQAIRWVARLRWCVPQRVATHQHAARTRRARRHAAHTHRAVLREAVGRRHPAVLRSGLGLQSAGRKRAQADTALTRKACSALRSMQPRGGRKRRRRKRGGTHVR